jgi:uncharacterized membrane protein (DUF2068 family)
MKGSRDGLIVLIGVFKLVKAVALIAAGVVALVASPDKIGDAAAHLARSLGVAPGHDLLMQAANTLWSGDGHRARRLGGPLIGYGCIFVVEGVGLLARRRWAEWLTVIVTGSFIPFEVYELVTHFGPGKIAALIVNGVIVAYLIWRRLGGASGPEQ